MRRRERVLSTLAILGSFAGGCGLILLSVFDTKRFPSLHRIFLLVFILGVGLSAIFTIIEVRSPRSTIRGESLAADIVYVRSIGGSAAISSRSGSFAPLTSLRAS